jgi:cell division protein FtsI (penicillin-binding protein 3)
VDGVRIGAKTGTAQVADETSGGYLNDSYLASTLAIFPIDNPKYIIYIAALNPKGSTIWGSSIASPGISEIITDMVRIGYVQSSAIESLSLNDSK